MEKFSDKLIELKLFRMPKPFIHNGFKENKTGPIAHLIAKQ